MSHDVRELERVFETCFLERYETRLVGGAPEPLYLPSPNLEQTPHRVVYREDYFASALHEVAHWCLAGSRRRLLEDYGYWYAEEGRTTAEQAEFEKVEARPQALEWIFSDACRFEFHLSADNLAAGLGPSSGFQKAVERAREEFLTEGLSVRAELFRAGIAQARG